MDSSELRPLEYQAYAPGQLLGVAEMNRARDAAVATRELLSRLVLTPGVLLGLEVTTGADGALVVRPGMALDPRGRQILLVGRARWRGRPVTAGPDGSFTLTATAEPIGPSMQLLTIGWNQEPSEADPTVLVDVPLLEASVAMRQEPPADALALCLFGVDQDTSACTVGRDERSWVRLDHDRLPVLEYSMIAGTVPPAAVPEIADLERRIATLEAAVAALEAAARDRPAPAGTPLTLTWDLSEAGTTGDVSVALSSPGNAALVGKATQTGGGPLEVWGDQPVLLTRWFGAQYPFLALVADRTVTLVELSFRHFHNHNPGFPSHPRYSVQLQLDSGDGFTDVGSPVEAGPSTHGTVASVDLGGIALAGGEHLLRWMPVDLARGRGDTDTEYFALDRLGLTVRVPG